MAIYAFAGSRDFSEQAIIEKSVARLLRRPGLHIVKVGDATGADAMVAKESLRWGVWPDVQVCHWPPKGSSRQERWMAAHERNGRVLDGADMLVAFYSPGELSSGTTDAIAQARERGILTHVYHEGRWSTRPLLVPRG